MTDKDSSKPAARPTPAQPAQAAGPATPPAGVVPGEGDDAPVPRLPRGRGLKLSRTQLFRIIGLTIILIFLVATQRNCADAVSTFVTSFDDGSEGAPSGSAGAGQYERLQPGMTEAETKAAIERARRAGSGSAQ